MAGGGNQITAACVVAGVVVGLVAGLAASCKPRMRQETKLLEAEPVGLEATEIAIATPKLQGKKLAPGEAGCPQGNSAIAGCLQVTQETSREPSFVTTLRYTFLTPPQPERPNLVFLHGGPGGSLDAYLDLTVLTELSNTHNVLMYDQRGGGLSTPLAPNAPEATLQKHFVAHHVADLEALRTHVLQTEKMIVVGHSFGAHLGLAYAVEFPNHVAKLVALNGAADGSGFVMQSTLRQRMFEKAAETVLGTKRYAELQAQAEAGKLQAPDGTPIESLFGAYHTLLYTYEGQTTELPSILKMYAKESQGTAGVFLSLVTGASSFANHFSKSHKTPSGRADDDIFPVIPRARKAATASSPRDTFLQLSDHGTPAPQPTVNATQNQWSVCSSLVTQKKVREVDPLYHKVAMARRQTRCVPYPAVASTFDVTSRLGNIRAPTLLTGGSHDPLIPYSLQARDFELLRMNNSKVTFIVFPESGHNPDESPVCFERTLLAFLEGTLPAGKIDCSASAAP